MEREDDSSDFVILMDKRFLLSVISKGENFTLILVTNLPNFIMATANLTLLLEFFSYNANVGQLFLADTFSVDQ